MKSKTANKDYFELIEHNVFQVSLFFAMFALAVVSVFLLVLPMFQSVFESLLSGKVYNAGETITYFASAPKPVLTTSYYYNWAIDITVGVNEISRYWVSPLQTLALPTILVGFFITVAISTLLPQKIGFMRQKIEREIENEISRITNMLYPTFSDTNELKKMLRNSGLSELHGYAKEWEMLFEDLRAVTYAIKWQNAGLIYRIVHINDAIKLYMRFYFTVKFSNAVLGLVYIGAAVLIIIIGLRGLKFIPPTQPSLVLFALGLEFSLLITYALTLMYSRQDEDVKNEREKTSEQVYLAKDFGTHRDIEKLLRVFIKSKKKN